LKPTYGRVSLSGIVPLSWSLDHPGPITQTVEDAAVLMELIAGHDARDPYSRRHPVPKYTEALTGNIKGLRIGIPKSYFYDRLAPEVHSAVHAALKTFERLGATMVEIDLPGAPLQRAIFSQIASPEAFAYHEKLLERHWDQYGADVRGRIEAGRMLLSIDYVRAQRARSVMKDECKTAFRAADVIVTPTLPIVAPKIDQTSVELDGTVESIGPALTRFTRHFNITGLPAISIPCGFTPDNLPIGLQIAGKAFDESTVLRAAHAYEQDAKWFERRPLL
jgi:aspartyl-tRNA(Asn)/glutamyl-tRNA(Gln) amidotransferase subunit A